jgi:single-stranded-DNA-specific exonuclease
MVEFIRSSSDILVDVGGHPMAAGFTVETKKISLLKKRLTREAAKFINEDIKKKTLKIDCELNFSSLTQKFYDQIQTLAPFGVGNSQPVFISKDVLVANARLVGNDKHLKLKLSQDGKIFDAIFFAIGERNINTGDKIDVVYLLDENIWNQSKSLQLKIRDFK